MSVMKPWNPGVSPRARSGNALVRNSKAETRPVARRTARFDLASSIIEPHNPCAAKRSSEKIRKAAKLVLNNPAIGIRLENQEDREFFTSFGQWGPP